MIVLSNIYNCLPMAVYFLAITNHIQACFPAKIPLALLLEQWSDGLLLPSYHGIYVFGFHEVAEHGISYEVYFAIYNLKW